MANFYINRGIDDAPNEFLKDYLSKIDTITLQFPPIPSELDDILREISLSGRIPIEWTHLSKLIMAKIVMTLKDFNDRNGFSGPVTQSFESRVVELLELLNRFDDAPFTIQRLVELLLNPSSQYSSTHKLINALERILSVTSTIDFIGNTGGSEDSVRMDMDDDVKELEMVTDM